MNTFSKCRNTFNNITMRAAVCSSVTTIAATAGLVASAIARDPSLVTLFGAGAAGSAVTAAGSGIAYGFGSEKIQNLDW
jgi:hypothetical protein